MRSLLDAVKRRDGDAYLRHAHPQGPFAEHRADQSRDRRDRLCRRPAPASRPRFEREAQSANPAATVTSGRTSRLKRRRRRRRRGLDAGSGGDAGPHREPLAFAWSERKIMFAGDHVMGWSTSIVAPPDGSMIDYMASLRKAARRAARISTLRGTARKFRKRCAIVQFLPGIAGRARPRSCIGSPRARPISRRWCARFISASIPG